MWIDHLYLVQSDGAGAMDERRIGELLAPFIGTLPGRPRVVVDVRPTAARESSTATYQLLVALGLPSAAPVTVSFARPDGVADALESLLAIASGGTLLLVTARRSGRPRLAACCLVSDLPMTANSVPLPECPAGAEPGDPFTDVMLALHARYGEALSPVPAQT
jgi:hypothetical protein